MAFDYKKEYKEFYISKNKPSIIEIPKMNYIAVRGTGNPNEVNGDYQNTIGLLKDEPANSTDMLAYYSTDMIEKYGVIGIEIRICELEN